MVVNNEKMSANDQPLNDLPQHSELIYVDIDEEAFNRAQYDRLQFEELPIRMLLSHLHRLNR